MAFVGTVVVIGVVIALLRGGRVRHLAQLELHHTWTLFLAVAVQLTVDLLAARGILGEATTLGWSALLLSQVLVVAFLLRNPQLAGRWLVGAGLALNAIVMAANGAMPVSPDAVAALDLGRDVEVPLGKHTVLDDTTRLPWLADIIPVPPLRSIVSVGDLVLAVGIVPMTSRLLGVGRREVAHGDRRGQGPPLPDRGDPDA